MASLKDTAATALKKLSGFFSGGMGRVAPVTQVSPSSIVSPQTQIGNISGPVTSHYVPTLPTASGLLEPTGNPREQGYGRTGTTYYGGWIAEDQKHDLEGRDGVEMYDNMYKSDYQVYTAIERGNSKIKEAKWYIEPDNDKDNESIREAGIIAKYLFEKSGEGLNKSWLENLTEILTYRHLGLSVFEPLWREVTDEEFGRLWVWKTLGWRSAKTLWQAYFVDDKLWSIRQLAYGDDYNYQDIPGNEIMIFTYNKTGHNIYGPPPTRRMYGPYIRKNNAHQINAMGIENSARGVIDASIPEDRILSTEATNYKQAVADFARGTQPALFHPAGEGWKLQVVDLKYDATAVQDTIRMEDASISKTTENEQAEMGLTEVGSKGMHSSKQENSDLAVKVDARYICEVLQQTIDDFVRYNFPPRKRKGKLKLNFTGIDSKAGYEESQKDQVLQQMGFLSATNPIHRAYINKKYDIPGGDEIEAAEVDAETGGEPAAKQEAVAGAPAAKEIGKEAQEHGKLIKEVAADAKAGEEKPIETYAAEIVTAHKQSSAEMTEAEKQKRFTLAEFKPRRVLTLYEGKVNFTEINRNFDAGNIEYNKEIKTSVKDFILPKFKKDLLSALKYATNKHSAAQGVELGKKTKVKEIIRDIIEQTLVAGRSEAVAEIKGKKAELKTLKASELKQGTYGWIKAQTDVAIDSLYGDMKKKSSIAALNAIDSGATDEQAVFDAGEAINSFLDDENNLGGGFIVNKAYNEGRYTAFSEFEDDIQGYQFSAILDDATCDECEALDGQTYKADDPEVSDEPPLHSNCRCIIIPILNDEKEPDEWTGLVPNEEAE